MNRTFDYSLFDAISALIKNRFALTGWVLVTVVVVGVVTLQVPKTFKSEGKIFVRLGRENASLDATTTLGEHSVVAMPLSREEEINSVTEMIKNRSLFEKIVDDIGPKVILKKAPFQPEETNSEDGSATKDYSSGLDLLSYVVDPVMGLLTSVGVVNDLSLRERAIIRVSKDLAIEPLEKSNVIQIEFESYDPRLAQAVVDNLIKHYEVTHAQVHRSSGSFVFLDEQTKRIKTELEEAENAFEAFKNTTGILEIEQQRTLTVGRISDITDKKLEYEAKLAGIEKEIENLNTSLKSIDDTIVVESTTGPGQEGVDGMAQEFFKLQGEVLGLQSKFSEDHPKVIEATKKLDALQKIMDLAEQTRGEKVQGVNEVFGKTKITLIAKEAERKSIQKIVDTYVQQLDDLNNELESFNANDKSFSRLKRQVFIKDQSFRKSTNNLEQARIDDLLQTSKLSNISVAQAATLSYKPSKPNKLLNLLLGFVFGSMLGVGRILWRDYDERYKEFHREPDFDVEEEYPNAFRSDTDAANNGVHETGLSDHVTSPDNV